jgi:hypothetical protein
VERDACLRGGFGDELPDALTGDASAAKVRGDGRVEAVSGTVAPQPVEVLDHGLDNARARLHLTDAGFGRDVRTATARAFGSCRRKWPMRISHSSLTPFSRAGEDLEGDAPIHVARADVRGNPPYFCIR